MLEVVHVTKRYRKVLANDDINLTIEDGRIGVLLGPNGAGKSTIIKCIMGFLKYQGQIQVNGLENKSIEAKKIMGYIPEIPSLYPNLTVDEHMEFIARAYKLKDYKAYKDALLERFDLTDKKKKFGDELSKGMQQKLSICCGLLPKPRLVLFDEPMIGLDPHAIKELKKVFEELRDSGCMVLVSTHMIDSMEELWDTTYIMKQGRVAAVVERENLKDNNKSLEDIFFEITEGAALEREVEVMRLWGYYAWHTFWNTIKKMFRSTFLVIILAIFGFGIIFGLIGGVVGSMVEKQQSVETVESSSEADRVQEEAMEEEETQKTPQEIAAIKTYVEAGVMIVFLAILLWGMYSGSKDGTDIFQMADVNLLFTAPMKPQSVLMFRLSFQMVATVFASIYLVFQIPNLVVNMGLGASAVVAIFAGWILLLVFQRLMIVLTYTVCTTHEKLKPYVFPLIVGIVVLLGMIAGGTYLANGQNLLEAAHMTFASHWLRYLPVIGWYKGMIMCAVNGELFPFLVYLGLLLVSVAVLIFAIWHMKADFYEDALASAGKRAQMLEAAKEGRVIAGKAHAKKQQKEGNLKGWGASVFFTKEIYCRKRTAKFGIITNTMLFYLLVSVGISLFCVRIMEVSGFLVPGCILFFVLFFRNMGNPIAQETARNWLFLVPENPYKKVFFGVLAGTSLCAMDLLPALVVSALLLHEKPGIMLLWYLTYLVADFMFSEVGLLLEALVPASAMDTVKSMIQILLRCIILVIVAVFLAIGYFFGGIAGALVFTCAASAGIGGAISLIYPWMLHQGR